MWGGGRGRGEIVTLYNQAFFKFPGSTCYSQGIQVGWEPASLARKPDASGSDGSGGMATTFGKRAPSPVTQEPNLTVEWRAKSPVVSPPTRLLKDVTIHPDERPESIQNVCLSWSL